MDADTRILLMDLSFSELKDLVFNASMGSNLPAGVCEDLSFGVTFLESRSLPGGKELLYSLKCERHPPVSPQKNGVSLIFCNSRAIFEGLSAIDLLVSESCKSVILENIDELNNPLAKRSRMLLDDNVFKELTNLASKMLVPESELSRTTGAGAGNIDND